MNEQGPVRMTTAERPPMCRRSRSLAGTVVLLSLALAGNAWALAQGDETTAQDGLPAPDLAVQYRYVDLDLPIHFTDAGPVPGAIAPADNTPAGNQITDAGARLGRVLFYDRRLSANDTVACASCHRQSVGFSDPRRLSVGFGGGETARNSMGLANARYYANGHMFWDERAATLEAQVLMPIQDATEMGMRLPLLKRKLRQAGFYQELFADAFGSRAITRRRIALALAQFVRSLVSYRSKYDIALTAGPGGTPDFDGVLSAQENLGRQLFGGGGGGGGRGFQCDQCHRTQAQILGAGPGTQPGGGAGPFAVNSGLDAFTIDEGAGDGAFKSPSLRNVEVTGPYMHDGRFDTLEQVIDFYDSGVQAHPDLSRFLRVGDDPGAPPARLGMSAEEKAALVAFLRTLTDGAFLGDPKFADPFPTAGWPATVRTTR